MILGDFPGVGQITRLDWALCVALVLSILAKKQNREFYLGLFDTRILKEYDSVEDGPMDSDTLVSFMAAHTRGGTNFEVPLRRGLQIMERTAFEKADFVFVTDGECAVSQTFLKEFHEQKEEKKFRVLSVACERGQPSSLKPFSDTILRASDITKADDASAKIFSIGS